MDLTNYTEDELRLLSNLYDDAALYYEEMIDNEADWNDDYSEWTEYIEELNIIEDFYWHQANKYFVVLYDRRMKRMEQP